MERKDAKLTPHPYPQRLNDDRLSLAALGGSRVVDYPVLRTTRKPCDFSEDAMAIQGNRRLRQLISSCAQSGSDERSMLEVNELTLSFLTQSLDPSPWDGVPAFSVIFPSSVKPL